MSLSAHQERSITRDPENSDAAGGQEVEQGTPSGAQVRGPELVDLAEFLPTLSDKSEDAILDMERRDVTPLVEEIMRKIMRLQLRCGLHKRFHFILETDKDDAVHTWAETGSANVNACSEIENQILTSPTLSFELSGMRTISESVTNRLNVASMKALKDALGKKNNSAGAASAPAPRQRTPAGSPIGNGSPRENEWGQSDFYDEWDGIQIPKWFPFLGDVYTEGPQVSDHEVLDIPEEHVRRFQKLPKHALEKVWSHFFRTLHTGIRRKSRKHKTLPFKYTLYTPPWLRKQIKVGAQLHRLGQVTIRSVRGHRSDWGYRTMTLILAVYLHLEPHFGKPILLFLLMGLPNGIGSQIGSRRRSERIEEPLRPRKIRLDQNGRPMTSNGDPLPSATAEPIEEITLSREEQDGRPIVGQGTTELEGELSGEGLNCAAGIACRFREDPEAQLLSGITGKCRKCRRPIHDICGGGEKEDKYCPPCRP